MSRDFKIFLLVFLISLPFFWGMNILEKNLEDFLFWYQMANNSRILTAQAKETFLEKELRYLKPIRNWQVEDIEIGAKSAISRLWTDGASRVLFEKEGQKVLPLASLTKLMTAFVALENYELDEAIEISKEAVEEEGDFGNFKVGEKFSIRELLHSLLMESSNDAAFALTEKIGQNSFLGLMNLEAKEMGLKSTFFVNPTGLDPDDPKALINYSSGQDLTRFTGFLLEKPLIWQILSQKEYDLYGLDGVFHHRLFNTNELLWTEEHWGSRIIGGKTGWTPEAQGCLLLVLEAPKGKGFLVNIILGSENRFEEMTNLINWIHQAYKW